MSDRVRRACLVLLLAAGASAGACFRGTLPAIELYRLETPPPTATTDLARSDGLALLDGGIAIAAYRAPGIYGDAAIPFRIGETQYGTYPSREWAIPLGVMLGIATQRALETRPITTGPALFDPPSDRFSAYVWRGTIREFEEVNRDAEVWAAVGLDVQLVRAADDSVLWTGSLRREARVPEGTMPAIIRTLSRLANEGIVDLAEQARAAVVRGSAAAARR
ncbi:MAG TPA: hypothetical protein VFZ11_11065 [Gemmatimonadaceae bacterium]